MGEKQSRCKNCGLRIVFSRDKTRWLHLSPTAAMNRKCEGAIPDKKNERIR
jgi:hypothetical protein